MKKFYRFLSLLLTCVLLLSLTACGNTADDGDGAEEETPVLDGKTMVLNVYNWG